MENNYDTVYENLKFYILIPVYNVENYIRDCIESVLRQTYQNFHMILVNDGSIDKSGEICEEYSEKDSRITVIHQKNLGQLAARETAVKYIRQSLEVRNTYAVFLDSDDTLKVNALETILKIVQKYACDMVIYGMDRVSNGKVIKTYDNKKKISGLIEDKRLLYQIVFCNSEYNSLCRKAISAMLLSDIDYRNYYHLLHAEDLLQSISYYKKCNKVFFFDGSLYNYTVNPHSVTQTVTDKNYYTDFTIRQKIIDFIKKENIFSNQDWIIYRSHCILLILSEIKIILSFNLSLSETTDYFNQIWYSEYYQNNIYSKKFDVSVLKYRAIFYYFFEKQIYFLIFILGKAYRKIRKRGVR